MSFFAKLLFAVALCASLSASAAPKLEDQDGSEALKLLTSLRARRGFFAYRFRPYQAPRTCDRNVEVCRGKGSCCGNKCVDLKRDRVNCGRCGKRCKYSELCCNGRCVRPLFDRNHCGGCNNNCARGSLCVYGMCGYA